MRSACVLGFKKREDRLIDTRIESNEAPHEEGRGRGAMGKERGAP